MMRLFNLFHTRQSVSGFSAIILSTTLLTSFANSVRGEHLEPRQAPAVVATSSFLRRGYQTSAVAGDWVYIDGGQFSYLDDSGASVYKYSSTLLSLDLSQNWTNATAALQSTAKPSGLPNLDNPSLWYYEADDTLYTGFTGYPSGLGSLQTDPLSLWSFKPDGTGGGAWNQTIGPNSSVWEPLTRTGGSLMAYSQTKALILGGDISYYEPVSPQTLLSSAVQFDMESQSFTNSSAPCCNATGGIERGAMQFVPSFGPEGLYIAMGGLNGLTYNTTDGLIGLSTVSVYDPAKQQWWNQTTTGSPPSARVSFCTAGINSTNGTYEIFVYGGYGWRFGDDSIQYDTINVLTLPAFHWFSVPYPPQYPRFAHSCNAVGGSQILSIGGLDARAKNDLPGPSNEYNNSADQFLQGLAIFDMTTMNFADQFTAAAPPYEQSDVVKQYYGQAQQGYLKDLVPQVATLLQTTHFTNTSATPTSTNSTSPSTPTPSPSKSHTGAIAGGTVGGILILLIILTSTYILLKRRRKNVNSQKPTSDPNYVAELSENPIYSKDKGVHEMHEGYRAPELGSQPLHELGGQGRQEMEQPAEKVELQTNWLSELGVNGNRF